MKKNILTLFLLTVLTITPVLSLDFLEALNTLETNFPATVACAKNVVLALEEETLPPLALRLESTKLLKAQYANDTERTRPTTEEQAAYNFIAANITNKFYPIADDYERLIAARKAALPADDYDDGDYDDDAALALALSLSAETEHTTTTHASSAPGAGAGSGAGAGAYAGLSLSSGLWSLGSSIVSAATSVVRRTFEDPTKSTPSDAGATDVRGLTQSWEAADCAFYAVHHANRIADYVNTGGDLTEIERLSRFLQQVPLDTGLKDEFQARNDAEDLLTTAQTKQLLDEQARPCHGVHVDVLDGLVNTKQQCKEIDSALKVGDFLEKTGPAEHTALEGIFCGLNHDGVKYREMSALDASNVLAESADGSIKITQEDMVCCLSLKDNHYVHSLVEYLSGKTVVLIALTGARSETAVGHWLTFVIYRNVTTGKQIVLRIDSLHNTGALQTEITTFLNYLESPSLIEKLSRTMSFMTDITTRK